MKKKYIFLIVIVLLSIGVYFLFFHKDKSLNYIPDNADIVVLVDIKKAKRQYISSFIAHPSKWFEEKNGAKNKISVTDSGLEIPDFLQIFHLSNTKISEWYTVLEINDKEKLSAFLKDRKFINDEKGIFKNNQLFVKINGEKCIVGTSDLNFNNIGKPFSEKFRNNVLNADSFMGDGLGSISFISELRTQNFSVDLQDDEIEIKNEHNSANFESLISDLYKKTQFLDAELDSENIKKIGSVFKENMTDSTSVNHLQMSANFIQVNDTIVSYEYDDNFNEIEKISYQKIVQPDFEIVLQTSNPEKAWTYFQNKKWINAKNQFTAIPFQPNLMSVNKNHISIKSTRKSVKINETKNQNYIFIKNNPLLLSSFKTLNNQFFKDIEYLFYGNKNQDYTVKIKFKKEKLPLILR
ncbi:hypothetical protein [Chryseobacterium indoltheticum]|uniref:DUF4340 domain-containing protein n=1 Tax=Chryseobacterium indoltheticum TaxID=254 RepID=A0A381F6R2_9FLAO|nr:hypothetical protein [Chryseobacterium indoltheticum]AZA72605.1 hypothetical protein EG358_02010 [Chryseobacterium indoltheticum]SIQ76594.1 hypothetical protein SAMN05421682_10869 [Chryseobacterium indoltheticum]SUX42187.1 Uncharacterised protein [Chryseobacterium indoltheticum]